MNKSWMDMHEELRKELTGRQEELLARFRQGQEHIQRTQQSLTAARDELLKVGAKLELLDEQEKAGLPVSASVAPPKPLPFVPKLTPPPTEHPPEQCAAQDKAATPRRGRFARASTDKSTKENDADAGPDA